MKISKVHIQNFRCLDDTLVDLTNNAPSQSIPLLFVIGTITGEGKTSFLDGIAAALTPSPQWVTSRLRNENNIRLGCKDFLLEVTLDKTITKKKTISSFPFDDPILYPLVEYIHSRSDNPLHIVKWDEAALALLNSVWPHFHAFSHQSKERFILEPISGVFQGFAWTREVLKLEGRASSPLNINQLCESEKYLLRVLTTGIFQTKLDIILLDAPERHLPEEWARELICCLQDLLPDTQIIVVTQSEEIRTMVSSYQRAVILLLH